MILYQKIVYGSLRHLLKLIVSGRDCVHLNLSLRTIGNAWPNL